MLAGGNKKTEQAESFSAPTPARLEKIRNLRDWLKAECPTVRPYIQPSVYGVIARYSDPEDSQGRFDAEFRSITAEEVKRLSKLLAEIRAAPPEPVTPTDTIFLARGMTPKQLNKYADAKDWAYEKNFLSRDEANALYEQMLVGPWQKEGDDKYAIHYGKSYNRGGPSDGEIPEIPIFSETVG
jgi:hypothetical protein